MGYLSALQKHTKSTVYLPHMIDNAGAILAGINLSRNGSLTSNNVTFDATISMTLILNMSLVNQEAENPIINIGMRNSTNFDGILKEGKFEQGNHLVINGLAPEQIQNLGINLGKILGEKLKEEMFVSMITRVMTVKQGLFERAQQAVNETNNALEQEQQLSNGITPEDLRIDINSGELENEDLNN